MKEICHNSNLEGIYDENNGFTLYLPMQLYASNLDIVDSKGRSFWDKRFVVYDTNPSLIIKTCKNKNKNGLRRQGLQFDRESRSIIAYTPAMERIVLESTIFKDNIILQGNKFIFLFADFIKYNPQDKYSLEFLDDNLIQWCMFWEAAKNMCYVQNNDKQSGIENIIMLGILSQEAKRERNNGVNIISLSIPIKTALTLQNLAQKDKVSIYMEEKAMAMLVGLI